jgi:hypothetical protein
MSGGYTIFRAAQLPSSVPKIIPGAVSPLANYTNNNTPYWIHQGSAGTDISGALNGFILNISNGDDTIIATTDFTPGNSYGTSILDTDGSGNIVNIIEFVPQGPRPYAQWNTNFSGDVFAPNLLNTITNQTTLSVPIVSPYATSPATGRIITETFTPPKSGMYLLQSNLTLNVNPAAVAVGPSDYVVIGLVNISGVPVSPGSTTLKPWIMPGDVTGQDYSIQGSNQLNLVAGTAYCLMFYVFNLSGSISLGEASSSASLEIIQLC